MSPPGTDFSGVKHRLSIASRRFSATDTAANTQAMQILSSLITPYVPWTTSAMTPQTVAEICNDVVINRRRRIVEFGAGVSTILLARLVHQLGLDVEITSFDESEEWIEVIRLACPSDSRPSALKLVHAPIVASDGERWYDNQIVASALPASIDLLIVDGPTAYKEEWQLDRAKALPATLDRMSVDSAVLLDDTNRKGEAQIARDWEAMRECVLRRTSTTTWFLYGDHWNASMF